MTWVSTLRVLVLATALIPLSAAAQSTGPINVAFVGGSNLNIQLDVTGDDKEINCSVVQDRCEPVNASNCGSPRNIQITYDAPTTANSYIVYPFWVKGNGSQGTGDCVVPADLPTGSTLLRETRNVYPDDLDGAQLTTDTFLEQLGDNVCPSSNDPNGTNVGVELQWVRLCLGFDLDGGGLNFSGGDGLVWAQILIDTKAPFAPSIGSDVTALDGSLRFVVAKSSQDTLTSIHRFEVAAVLQNSTTTGTCDNAWSAGGKTASVLTDSKESATITVSGLENGEVYMLCARVSDSVGNVGPASQPVFGTPLPACDFAECYPGELETGCQAIPASVSGLLIALALIMYASRRRWQ